MSYAQIGFALGFGRISGGKCGNCVVEYGAAEGDGIEPVRVVYDDFVAESIEPINRRN